MRVSILAYDLSHNCLVRTHVIAQLLERNHDVEVVGPMTTEDVWGPLQGKYEYKGVRTDSRIWNFPRAVPSLLEAATGDVLFARKPKVSSFGVGLVASRRTDRPLLLDIEDWELGLMYANWSRFTAPLAGLPRLIDVDSYYPTAVLESLTGLADGVTVSNTFLRDKFGGTIVPHIRDTDVFDPARFDKDDLRDELDLPSDDFLLTFTGTPRPHKGVKELAQAVQSIDRDDVKLVVVGGDDSPYAHTVKSVGGESVIMAGTQPFDEMPKWVAVADLVVAPQKQVAGLHGQIPAKVFDAMAMAKPVIATRISDLPQMLDGCGVLVDDPSPAVLADEIEQLVDAPERREALGARARERCVKEYSLDAYEPVMEDLIDDSV